MVELCFEERFYDVRRWVIGPHTKRPLAPDIGLRIVKAVRTALKIQILLLHLNGRKYTRKKLLKYLINSENIMRNSLKPKAFTIFASTLVTGLLYSCGYLYAGPLKAGVAKVNITNLEVGGLVKDSVYARALVLEDGITKVAIVSIDIPIIGSFLEPVRTSLQKDLNINPENVWLNASQLHTARTAVKDIDKRIISAVKKAWDTRVPVTVGSGKGHEDRIMENRRLKLTNGKEWTIRHANPLPPDEEVAGIWPVDPEIGILRLDRKDGSTLAVLYNFACHPYHDSRQDKTGWQQLGTTADYPGYASRVIENNLGKGAVALFLQGCDGDVTTVIYKGVDNPRDAEPLGNMLGLSTMKAVRNISCQPVNDFRVLSSTIEFPRRTDIPDRLSALRKEQSELLQSLQNTSLDFKTFISLYIKYNLFSEYPSYYSHMYMHENEIGRNEFAALDAENRRNIDKYVRNIYSMEKLARIGTNISLLERRQAENEEAGGKPISAEIHGMRLGDFVLVTLPCEASIGVALEIKNISPFGKTFVAAHTNSTHYNYLYAPTAEQFKGWDYEDSNTSLSPEWQEIFRKKAMEMLGILNTTGQKKVVKD
jgi:hypothetical protein